MIGFTLSNDGRRWHLHRRRLSQTLITLTHVACARLHPLYECTRYTSVFTSGSRQSSSPTGSPLAIFLSTSVESQGF